MRRVKARRDAKEAEREVGRWILVAREEGIPMTQIAKESGIRREYLYVRMGEVAEGE
jgi:hypothetical protein